MLSQGKNIFKITALKVAKLVKNEANIEQVNVKSLFWDYKKRPLICQ